MPPDFIDRLRAAAEAKEQEEADYRQQSRARLEALDTERTRAFRRYNLLKDMAAAAQQQAELPAGVDVQLAVAVAESGWSEGKAGYAEVRDQLRPVSALIHARLHPQPDAPPPADDVADSFMAFEAWYRQRFGQDFLELLGREPPSFQPLVDF